MIAHISKLFWIQNQDSMKLSNGTRIPLNKDYDFCRYVKPTDPTVVEHLTAELSFVSQESIGSVLNYPIMHGKGYNDKYVVLVYPKKSTVPCAFNVAIEFEHEGNNCMHIGLVMVVQDHQGNRLQGPMVTTNVFLYTLQHPNGFWITDLGRSPSGSRLFANFFSDVCPRPLNVEGDSCQPQPFHLSLSKAFYTNLARDTGISMDSTLEDGFVIKGSNGPGGAEALVGGIPKSRNQSYNRWMDRLCPDSTDEMIMVGHCSLSNFVCGNLAKPLKNLFLNIGIAVALLMLSIVLSVGAKKGIGTECISQFLPSLLQSQNILVSDDPKIWNMFFMLMFVTGFFFVAISRVDTHIVRASHARRAIFATILPFVCWTVIPRVEYRQQLISKFLFGGNRTAAFYAFVVFVLSLSFWREKNVARAMEANPVMCTTGNKVCDGMIKKTGRVAGLLGAIVGLSGFYQMHVNTYYPEFFGFVQPHMVTAFPYNCLSHPMYVGAVLGHYGQALSQMSPLGMQVALVSGLGYWTAANIFEDPFMDVFYGSGMPAATATPQTAPTLWQPENSGVLDQQAGCWNTTDEQPTSWNATSVISDPIVVISDQCSWGQVWPILQGGLLLLLAVLELDNQVSFVKRAGMGMFAAFFFFLMYHSSC